MSAFTVENTSPEPNSNFTISPIDKSNWTRMIPINYCSTPTPTPVVNENSLSWQSWCFIGASLVTIPIYLLVLVGILLRKPTMSLAITLLQSKRFTDAFGNLVLSQGVGDLLALIFFFFTNTMRSLAFTGPFFYSQREWAARVGFDSIFFFAFLRGYGIGLFSFQRYWCICHPLQSTKCKTQPLWRILAVHWIPSFFFLLVIFFLGPKTYCSETDVATDVKQYVVVISASVTSAFLILFALISFICYLFLIRHIYRNSVKTNNLKRRDRELRVSVQVFLQTIAIISLSAYHVAQAVFAYQGQYNPIREFYPLITVLLSIVNPWTALGLSKTLRWDVLGLFGVKKPIPMASSIVPIGANIPSRSMVV